MPCTRSPISMAMTGIAMASQRRPSTAPANSAAAATGEKFETWGSIRAVAQSATRPSARMRSLRSDGAGRTGIMQVPLRSISLSHRWASRDPGRPLRRPLRDDPRERLEAVGQRRRAGLQDQRRFDLAQEAVADRGQRLEARPYGELRRLKFLAAQGADHDVGVAASTCSGVTLRSLA